MVDYERVDVERGVDDLVEPSPQPTSSRDGKTKHYVFGHTSHFWVQDHESFQGDHSDVLRSLFIQKVYNILSAQLLMTMIISLFFMNIDSLRIMTINNAFGMILFSSLGSFGTLIVLMNYKDKYPNNLYLLSMFTFFESILMGVICAIYQETGLGSLIIQAFAITMMVFIILSLFASSSHVDFTPYSGLLVALLLAMVFWGFFAMIFGIQPGIIYSWIGVILFSGFIVIDTQMIVNKFGYEDYIIASSELYLDILNMFLYVLQILSSRYFNQN